MTEQQTVVVHVMKGVKVDVRETDQLDNDRVLVAEAPQGLKVAIHQVAPGGMRASASKISMCG